jgi:uncharacterized membrane protein YhaH (DUF805 family)
MHWFLDPITKHYADFEGRVGRQEYWMFILFSFILQIAFSIVGFDEVSMLVYLGLFVPTLALAARRLHDIGKSGWWQLLNLIPIIGWIIIIVWLATKTDPVANEYGDPAVPKTPAAAPAATPATTAAAPVATDTTAVVDRTPDTPSSDAGSADGSN